MTPSGVDFSCLCFQHIRRASSFQVVVPKTDAPTVSFAPSQAPAKASSAAPASASQGAAAAASAASGPGQAGDRAVEGSSRGSPQEPQGLQVGL